ncbi:MAG: PAP/fibrillin family protein [Cyanobacteria bacterium P01_G01_bin.67]
MVAFNALTIKATLFFAQSDLTLLEMKISVLDFLRNEALWITYYLDQNMRIGREATGDLFVFRR